MSKFARIIELPDEEQVLLTFEIDEDSDSIYVVQIQTDFKEVRASLVYGYELESDARKMMQEFTIDKGIKFRSNMASMLL